MSGPLQQNLAALRVLGWTELAELAERTVEPGPFQVHSARSGDPSLLHDGKAVHSRYDPRREAAALVQKRTADVDPAATMILVGLGLGYSAQAWMDARPEGELIVYEPDERVFALAMRTVDLIPVFERARLFVGSDGLTALADELRDRGLSNGRTPALIEAAGLRVYAADALDSLRRRLLASHADPSAPLRVLVVGPVYGGTLSMGPAVTRAFHELGHRAELFDPSSFEEGRRWLQHLVASDAGQADLIGGLTRLLGRAVVEKAREMGAQLVFALAQAPVTVEALRALREADVRTAMWFVEDKQLAGWWKQVAPEYDVFFHIQGQLFSEELAAHGAREAQYLPVAADPELHSPRELSDKDRRRYGSEVSHMGAGYFNRRRFFPHLLEFDFKLWGNDWDGAPAMANVLQEDGRRVSPEETAKIFQATRINLNLHSSTYTEGVNPHGDFVNPRTLEIAACGGFQLVDRRSLLAEMLVEGEEVAVFDDLESCRRQIRYYLDHPEEARRIAERGRSRVLAEHTYTHRIGQAVEIMRRAVEFNEVEHAGSTLRDLVAASGDDRELAEFLAGLGEPDSELSMEQIAERVRRREGELTRPEAFFLLMNEFQTWAKQKGLG